MIASQQSTDNAQKIKYPAHHSSIRLGHYVYWLTFVTVLTLAATAATEASAQGTGIIKRFRIPFIFRYSSKIPAKCYFFGPGITIPGAEYRRDYGLSQNQCARVCKSDACCMAFEWQKDLSICTLKARSLNGTVTAIGGNVYFGLCLDYGEIY
jgi:hypothetical protein